MTHSGKLGRSANLAAPRRGRSRGRCCDVGVTIAGAALAGLAVTVAVAGPGWQAEVAALMVMAWGLYMMHAALREFASELSVEARAMALSLHSLSFFMSQSAGQIAYGVGRLQPGKLPTMLTGGAIMVVFVLALARWRRPSQRRAGRRTGSAN